MLQKEKIKTFVQQTLGCGCPEEVFREIYYESNIPLNNIILRNKINIGNKLLIYIVEMKRIDSIRDTLAFLLDSGRKERDRFKFNRFRLVLATDNVDEMRRRVQVIFNTIEKDELIHLHVVHKDDILL